MHWIYHIQFQIANGYIPEGFLQADIKDDGQRHLLFATEEQLTQLADLQTWYIDGTFKVYMYILMHVTIVSFQGVFSYM